MTVFPQSHDRINAFLERLRSDEELQQALKPATTAEGVAAVALSAGFDLSPAELVKDFAQRLLEAEETQAVRLFDNCGWDHGELSWVLKTWDQIGR
jgi:predicted ribosomally synthesized peptide with nif11-like leader